MGNGFYEEDIFSICAVMTDESLGEPMDRLAAVNDIMLNLGQEECLDHTYESFLGQLTETSWSGEGVGWRQWIWQTCTEFGWYQTTNQESGVYGHTLPLEFFEQWCQDAFGPEFTHAMGVLEDLHDGAPAIYITGTSHCADMYPDSSSDPEELTAARIRIGSLVKGWVENAKK